MPKERDDRRVFRSRPISAPLRPGSGSNVSAAQTPSRPTPPRERKRKAVSVYLDQSEVASVREYAAFDEREVSDVIRRAVLFECEFGLGQLRRRVERGDPDAGKLIIHRALLLANLDLWELLPAPPPPPEPVEVIRYLPAPPPRPTEPAALPPPRPEPVVIAAPVSPPATGSGSQVAAAVPPLNRTRGETAHTASSFDLVRLAVSMFRFCADVISTLLELSGWFLGLAGKAFSAIVRGFLRAGPRPEVRSQEAERWSSGALVRVAIAVALVPCVLPVDYGPGAIGYYLLGGDETALAETTKRVPLAIGRRLVAGYKAASTLDSIETIEACLRRSKRENRPVTCKVTIQPSY